jgi:DNA primase
MTAENTFEKIKASVDIASTIQTFVKLKKAGSSLTGLCPFHSEKTPSFTVNPLKGFYHCFGCKAHGDVISFVSKIKNLSYKEAAMQIAEQNNIKINITNQAVNLKENNRKKEIYNLLDMANKFFIRCLSPESKEYLLNRGINEALIKEFNIGFAPAQSQLISYLLNQGISKELIEEAGLGKKDSQGKLYEFFRGRITFPIIDYQNRIIGFGSRVLFDTNKVKYLNSPETPVFKKFEALYGEDKMLEAYKKNRCIVVEGYLDVIAMHKAGIIETVASLGTAVTLQQLQKIWGKLDEIVLCLDSDSAGRNATFKATLMALEMLTVQKKLSIVTLPNMQDPDSIINANDTLYNIKELIKKRVPASQYLLNKTLEIADLTSAEAIAEAKSKLKSYCNTIKDVELKNSYFSFFLNGISNAIFLNKRFKSTKKSYVNREQIIFSEDPSLSDALAKIEFSIIEEILYNLTVLQSDSLEEKLTNLEFTNKNLELIFNWLLQSEANNIKKLKNFPQIQKTTIKEKLEKILSIDKNQSMEDSINNLCFLCEQHKLETLKKEFLESIGDNKFISTHNAYLQEIQKLQKQINDKQLN